MKGKLWMLAIIIAGIFLPLQPVQAMEPIPDVESEYVYVYNLDTKTSVYEQQADVIIHPASMTKIMTVIVALEQSDDLNAMVMMSEDIFAGLEAEHASVAGFAVGDEVSLKDLLYGIMLPSGADASRAVAKHIAGSEKDFVALMNAKSEALGLTHTHFENTIGLDEDTHVTTAKEMGRILAYAIENEVFMEMFCAEAYTTAPIASAPKGIQWRSTVAQYAEDAGIENMLIKGGKTGFTFAAGHCLASISKAINGTQYLCITAKAPGTFQDPIQVEDTSRIYAYLQAHYTYQRLYEKGEVITTVAIDRLFGESTISYLAETDIYVLRMIDETPEVTFEALAELKEPIKKGEQLGTITIKTAVETKELPFYSDRSLFDTPLLLMISGGVILVAAILLYGIRQKQKRHQESEQWLDRF